MVDDFVRVVRADWDLADEGLGNHVVVEMVRRCVLRWC